MIEDLKKVGLQPIGNNEDGLDDKTLAKVNALRDKRDALNEEAHKIQDEIDKTILEFNNFSGLEGKYIEIEYDDTPNVTIYCGPIYKVDRIYSRSCRIYTKKFLQVNTYEDGTRNLRLLINNDVIISKKESIKFEKRKTTYKEISKETFDNILDEEILKFKQNK